MISDFYRYVRNDREQVTGWFERTDSQLFYEILSLQNTLEMDGAVAEIGVHHGKSFIALCLGLVGDQKAYAIDIFAQQNKNLDSSGLGDRHIFQRNLDQFGIQSSRVVINERSSDEVSPSDILSAVGRVRFFSVDGGHWRKIVRNDLDLASAVLADGGVIALDDFMRPEWPDVSLGFFDWLEGSSKSVIPFAIGFNKVYLCHRDYICRFQQCLSDSAFLPYFRSKHYEFYGIQVPVFHTCLLPEKSALERCYQLMRLYYPNAFASLRALPITQSIRDFGRRFRMW